jgi:hypothetical protein
MSNDGYNPQMIQDAKIFEEARTMLARTIYKDLMMILNNTDRQMFNISLDEEGIRKYLAKDRNEVIFYKWLALNIHRLFAMKCYPHQYEKVLKYGLIHVNWNTILGSRDRERKEHERDIVLSIQRPDGFHIIINYPTFEVTF